METKICKVCIKCLEEKSIEGFSLEKRKLNNVLYRRNTCKQCRYKSENKEKGRLRDSRFNAKRNKTEKYKQWRKTYEYKRYHTDIQFRLAYILRRRLKIALKNNAKTGKTLEYLGCSLEEFRTYLESKFTKEMTWNNQGSYWHIDHIKPLALFDLSDDTHVKQACHYTNLQPLEAKENLKKGAKYE